MRGKKFVNKPFLQELSLREPNYFFSDRARDTPPYLIYFINN